MHPAIDFHSDARDEFDGAVDWYLERSPGAAIGFIAAVDEALDLIAAHPNQPTIIVHGCRYRRVRKYPFSIVYTLRDSRLLIIAVAHAKRRPGYWRERL